MYKKLFIITDTKGQFRNGEWFIFNAVANEIDVIKDQFESVTILFSDYTNSTMDLSLNKLDSRVKVFALPKIGGETYSSKIRSFMLLSLYLIVIIKNLFKNNYVHLRGPNSVTLLSVFIVSFFQHKKIWFKFATNWNNSHSSFNYKFQKWYLTYILTKSKVTVNGFWDNLPEHIISLENPCLSIEENNLGKILAIQKEHRIKYQVVFCGRLEYAKGVDLLIEFIPYLKPEDVDCFHIVGMGVLESEFINSLTKYEIPFKFHGILKQTDFFEILKGCSIIFLPSRSEGFPKVLAEAMNFGCLPICSNVGSISHYIENDKSGFILNDLTVEELIEKWKHFLTLDIQIRKYMEIEANEVAKKFTFERYYYNLLDKVLR